MRPKNYSIPRTRGKKVELACDCGCGTIFYRYWNKVSAGENFLNREHGGIARRKRYLQDHCGVFLPLFEEYLADVVGRRYRDARSPINHVAPFLKYLGEIGIDSIADVEPSHVTSFQIWGREHGYIAASKDASTLSTFFKWAVVTDHYKEENPVTPAVHGRRKTRGSGRPYSFDEMEEIRRSLQGEGMERLRAFFEIASESGLRNAEIRRIRLSDVSAVMKRIRVGLPNKTMRERHAFFAGRAERCIAEWLAVRRSDCGHDFLFHNCFGGVLRGDSILNEFKRALCKIYAGRIVNESGLESFSIHRLRHTTASALANSEADATTLMTALGWVSPETMAGYIKIDQKTMTQGYIRARNVIARRTTQNTATRQMTIEEWAASEGL